MTHEEICEQLLDRYGEAMLEARPPQSRNGCSASGYAQAKRIELQSMHGRNWHVDSEQRYMLRWAVEAIEARNKRKGHAGNYANERTGFRDGPDHDAKQRAEHDHHRENLL